jgi:hypothetical protein
MFCVAGGFLLLISSVPGFSQSRITPPAFNVAEVKVNKSGDVRMSVDMQGGGTLTMRNVTGRPRCGVSEVSPDPLGGPTVFEAVEEQLVLKLERRKVPLPLIVVDRVASVPIAN